MSVSLAKIEYALFQEMMLSTAVVWELYRTPIMGISRVTQSWILVWVESLT